MRLLAPRRTGPGRGRSPTSGDVYAGVVVRRAVIPVVLAALVLACATQAPAAAPSLQQIVTALKAHPSYVDPAASLDASGQARLRAVANARKAQVRLALLSAVPSGARSESQTASAIRSALKFPGAVAVAFPDNVAVAGPDTAKLHSAAAAAKDKRRLAALTTFATRYAPPEKPKPATTGTTSSTSTSTTSSSSSGSSDSGLPWWGWVLIVLGVLGVIALVVVGWARRGGGGGHRGRGLIDAARRLALERAQSLGRDLTETAVQVAERDDPEIAQQPPQGSRAREPRCGRSCRTSTDRPPSARRNEALDQAEWHLGVAIAHLEGTAEPPHPRAGTPARCFFDAAHGLATVEVDLELPGVRTVAVGALRARRREARRGGGPTVGVVSVGRRTAPLGRGADLVRRLGLGPRRSPASSLRRPPGVRERSASALERAERRHGTPHARTRTTSEARRRAGTSPRPGRRSSPQPLVASTGCPVDAQTTSPPLEDQEVAPTRAAPCPTRLPGVGSRTMLARLNPLGRRARRFLPKGWRRLRAASWPSSRRSTSPTRRRARSPRAAARSRFAHARDIVPGRARARHLPRARRAALGRARARHRHAASRTGRTSTASSRSRSAFLLWVYMRRNDSYTSPQRRHRGRLHRP